MSELKSFNENPNLVAMKEDVAQRKFNLNVKSALIIGALTVVGVLLGMAVLPALGLFAGAGSGLMAAYAGGAAGFIAGGWIAGMTTMKESSRLSTDQQYLETYIQGKNNWGKGYREEVAEHGYSLGGPVAGLPPQGQDRVR